MSPAYARLDVGLKLFRPDAKHMPMPNLGSSEVTKIKRAIMFITQESISCAYANLMSGRAEPSPPLQVLIVVFVDSYVLQHMLC